MLLQLIRSKMKKYVSSPVEGYVILGSSKPTGDQYHVLLEHCIVCFTVDYKDMDMYLDICYDIEQFNKGKFFISNLQSFDRDNAFMKKRNKIYGSLGNRLKPFSSLIVKLLNFYIEYLLSVKVLSQIENY